MKVQIVQHDIIDNDIDKNLINISSKLTDGSDLIVLPEMFNCGFTNNAIKHIGKDQNITIDWMQNEASKHNCLICGSLAYCDNNQVYNRMCVVNANGIITYYDKRHLFSMGGIESSAHYTAGTERKIIHVADMRCLLQICYDLRFPVWSRYQNDYDAIIYIANWPSSRSDVWRTLLKARAIENQCYVIGVNRIGFDGNVNYSGNSMIFGPRGEIIVSANDNEEESIMATLPLDALNHFRNRFKVLNDADTFTIK